MQSSEDLKAWVSSDNVKLIDIKYLLMFTELSLSEKCFPKLTKA